ncbi:MAG: flagellar basal body L-ring protein FlgH [Planctomycetota bacterium]
MRLVRTLAIAATTLMIPAAGAQSLYERPVRLTLTPEGLPDPARPLRGVSMLVVIPPPPVEFKRHDLVSIIVDEISTTTARHELETTKEYDTTAEFGPFPSLRHLLELQLQNGDSSRTAELGLRGDNEFTGEGEYTRDDRFTARVQAEVIDVKPNGNLVLEARKTIIRDNEVQIIVLAGVCRGADISQQNTVLSSQIADLTIAMRNEGDVREAAKKGLIPRFLETVFNF